MGRRRAQAKCKIQSENSSLFWLNVFERPYCLPWHIKSTPNNSNLHGKSKKFEWSGAQVIGSSKKIAGSKEKTVFTAEWTFKSHSITEMWSENWKILPDCKSERNHCINRACVSLFWEVKLFHVKFVTNNIDSLHW